ncbi:MAG: hypothetical protein AB2814_03725 [Candidatus Sedimenticola endophacoides]
MIPCLDEGAVIEGLLRSLQPMRDLGHELILVDGGCRDGSAERAGPWVDQLLKSPANRHGERSEGG